MSERKQCLTCNAMLAMSDPDLCELCDLHKGESEDPADFWPGPWNEDALIPGREHR